MEKNKFAGGGFTLLELVVSMALGLIILGTVYGAFAQQNRTLSLQEQITEMQQNTRMAMELMLRDIRMAGYNPTKTIPWTNGVKPGLTEAALESLSFVSDLNGDGNTMAGSSSLEENIGYEKIACDGVECLGRKVNGVVSPVVENIESLAFNYYDGFGNALSVPPVLSKVRKIQVSVTARTAQPDASYVHPEHGDHYRRYSLTFNVMPRNLGLYQ